MGSHRRAVLSQQPVTIILPSRRNASELTRPGCTIGRPMSRPVATSHRRAVLSLLPDMTVLPSGLNPTDRKFHRRCPMRLASCRPVTVSHSLAVLSLLPVRINLPSGLKASAETALARVTILLRAFPEIMSHAWTSPIDDPNNGRHNQAPVVRANGHGRHRATILEKTPDRLADRGIPESPSRPSRPYCQ